MLHGYSRSLKINISIPRDILATEQLVRMLWVFFTL